MSDPLAESFVRNWSTCRATLTEHDGRTIEIQVRQAKPSDQPAIAGLRAQLSREITLGQPHTALAPSLHLGSARPGLCITQSCPNTACDGPQASHRAKGYLGWLGLGAGAQSRGLVLHEFCVDPNIRGRGLGRCALRLLLTCCDRAELELAVAVSHLNPAKQLYLDLGFEVVGQVGPFAQLTRPRPIHSAR